MRIVNSLIIICAGKLIEKERNNSIDNSIDAAKCKSKTDKNKRLIFFDM